MTTKTALQKIAPLLTLTSFTSKEARELGVSAALLSYYVQRGDLERIGHGVYRCIDAPTISDFRWEDLVHAMMKVKNGVICLVSALALYDLTEDIPRQHWIAIANTTRHRASPDIRIVRMRNIQLGRSVIKVDDVILPIFDRERTLVDSFRYLGVETAIKALRIAASKQGREKIDFEKMRYYAKKLRININPYLLSIST